MLIRSILPSTWNQAHTNEEWGENEPFTLPMHQSRKNPNNPKSLYKICDWDTVIKLRHISTESYYCRTRWYSSLWSICDITSHTWWSEFLEWRKIIRQNSPRIETAASKHNENRQHCWLIFTEQWYIYFSKILIHRIWKSSKQPDFSNLC